MSKRVALLFAGQGAQYVGMGRDLAEQFPVAADLFIAADKIPGRKLSEIAWNGPAEELTKTSNCQPALYVHSLAALEILRNLAGEIPIAGAAGLSLGEITAHAAAGTFDFATGLKLVQRRGEFMDEACAATLGGMAALIGCDFFIELGPGGVLAGLLRRTRKELDVISVNDAESVRKCAEAL